MEREAYVGMEGGLRQADDAASQRQQSVACFHSNTEHILCTDNSNSN